MRQVDANPTKEFFVRMITRDIDLKDAVLDLLDNSVDGARNQVGRRDAPIYDREGDLAGYHANISVTGGEFNIEDNCGGITIENATTYAFRFGRHPDAPPDVEGTIGLYGIGMKRAFLKMGNSIFIRSETGTEAFGMNIDVEDWLEETDWDFTLDDVDRAGNPGTLIQVTDLYEQVSRTFADSTFRSNLVRTIARDYSFIIRDGFTVVLNGADVHPHIYTLRESEEIKPVRIQYSDEESGVYVEILAGMAEVPPDDPSADEEARRPRRETDYYGWFVVCNGRVVLAVSSSGRSVSVELRP